jgi:exodeoxyribonuclease V alpha subunit
MAILEGILERITYCSDETGFVVARFQEKDKRDLTTIVGNLAGITPGESLKLAGEWVQNRKFGEQFKVESFSVIVPATLNGITKYLGSGWIKGIGPVMADRIVAAFGLGTLEVLNQNPKRLSEVEGIGPKRIEMITRAWEEQKEVKEIMIFLQGYGVSAAYSAKIYRHYGSMSIPVVKENPYRLAEDIQGIGFLTADRIAQNMGMDPNSLVRAKAGLLFVLNGLTEQGHVYSPENDLVRKSMEVLKVDEELVIKAVTELSQTKKIFVEEIGDAEGQRGVYLAPLYFAERGIGELLDGLTRSASRIRPIDAERAVQWIESKLGIHLADKQRQAVELAAKSKVLVITGGPGTGKTTIITAVLKIFQQMKLRVLLGAPTGRAAKRMSEATSWEARTIHRLLEYSPKEGRFKKDHENLLEADAIVIDEASMVDTVLMYHLLRAVPPHVHLILVGDVDQLPSVGPGNVLKDIIESAAFTVIRLTEIFRQVQKSLIIVNAHRINEGDFPLLKNTDSDELADFYFIEEQDPEEIRDRILFCVSEMIPRRFRFHPIRDVQVLTPMHRGIIGAVNLNAELQKRLNPEPPNVVVGLRTFKTGDKVMQIANNYDREVFNGDIGWVSKISQEDREMVIDFDGRLLAYDFSDLDEVVLAYAISVHKSQGSEYPAVVLPVSTQHYVLLQRNLIYTGITRARKLVVLIGTKKALSIAIRNDKPHLRFTRLCERLKTP